jgi:hypothetical protein
MENNSTKQKVAKAQDFLYQGFPSPTNFPDDLFKVIFKFMSDMILRLVCKHWNKVSSELHRLLIILGYSTPRIPSGKVPHIKIIMPDSFLETEDSIRTVKDLLMQISPTVDSNTKVVLCDFTEGFMPCIGSLGPSLEHLILTASNELEYESADLRNLPNPVLYLDDMRKFKLSQCVILPTVIQEFSIKSICKGLVEIDAHLCKQLSSLEIEMAWITEKQHIAIRITCNPSEEVTLEKHQYLAVRVKGGSYVDVGLPWRTYRLEILLPNAEPTCFEVHPAKDHSLWFTHSSNGEFQGFNNIINLKRIDQ